MFDLSTLTNSAQPNSLALILFSAMMSFGLSLFLVLTYEKTSREVARPDHFIQSIVLFAVVTTTIMQAIGDSLARSFGIFGALSIVKFRSRISNPRDVAFVFATMAVGISCGVHSFMNGVVGTVIFCAVVLLLRFSPFSQKHNLVGTLRFNLPEGSDDLSNVQLIIKKYCGAFSLKGYRIFSDNKKHKDDIDLDSKKQKEGVEYEYLIRLKDEMEGVALAGALKKNDAIKEIRLYFSDIYESPLN